MDDGYSCVQGYTQPLYGQLGRVCGVMDTVTGMCTGYSYR